MQLIINEERIRVINEMEARGNGIDGKLEAYAEGQSIGAKVMGLHDDLENWGYQHFPAGISSLFENIFHIFRMDFDGV